MSARTSRGAVRVAASSPSAGDSPSATGRGTRRATALLHLGAAAGPLYVLVGLAQVLARDGFDVRRHALSLLTNGEHGWIQVGNFLASGALAIAGAIGCRGALRGRRGGTWGPILLGVWGLGLVGSGLFPADPGAGFPPGTEAPAEMTRNGLLHFVCGGIAFYALIAACGVFARRLARGGHRGLAWYSGLTGAGFFASFAAIASGSTAAAVMIAFYVAVAWIWAWHTVALLHVARREGRAAVESGRSARQSEGQP